ncbi:MAG: CHAT domain-containing protein [Coleofasciculaceae cyanobacterium SM2_3_26]|nr:CHAT domain-containing protein [Coleofasciculaceae cyanobacterium SM2_3_26]
MIESLQLAELDNFFQDACSDVQPTRVDAVDPNAAVVYTILLQDPNLSSEEGTTPTERLEVIVALPGQPLHHHTTQLKLNQVSDTVTQLRGIVTNLRLQPALAPAQDLYDWIVRPVAAKLQAGGAQTLVFVLDSDLRNLPVATLHDGDRYLIETYATALIPSLQLLDPRPLSNERLEILGVGLTEARQGFEPLPYVAQELDSIRAELPAEILLDEAFTKAEFQSKLDILNTPIIHIATHGEFSSQCRRDVLSSPGTIASTPKISASCCKVVPVMDNPSNCWC